MGWLLGCFTCTGKHYSKASYLHRERTKVSSGRPSSAAVAHATSPEDLYKVRRVSASAVRNGYNDRGLFESQGQSKKIEVAKTTNPKGNDAIKTDLSNAQTLQGNEELESLRTKLMQEADAARKLSDEIEYLKACQSLLESPSGSFRVTFDSMDESSSGQVDCGEHTWLISSVVTPIQPHSLLVEACSSPSNSPWHGFKEGCSLYNRGPKNGDIEDKFQGSNVLKCAELNLFRVMSGACDDESKEEVNGSFPPIQCGGQGKVQAVASHLYVPSTSWAFFEAKLDTPTQLREEGEPLSIPAWHNIPSPPWTFFEDKIDTPTRTFASSEDLLQEHLDVSSLIEDSALITNWELSLGDQSAEQGFAHGHSLDPSQGVPPEGKWEAKLHSSGQECHGHLEDDHSFGPLEDNSMDKLEVTLFEGMVNSENDQGLNSPKFVHLETAAQLNGGSDHVRRGVNISRDTYVETQLFEVEFHDDSGVESALQSCCSSQFSLSKCLWSSSSRNNFEREENMPLVSDYVHHDDSDVHEVLLSRMHAEVRPVEEAESYEHDAHPLGKEDGIEPTARGSMFFLLQPQTETSPVETLEQGNTLARGDEARFSATGPMQFPEQGEAFARKDAPHLAVISPSGDQNESQRKMSSQSSLENVVLDQQATSKVEHEHAGGGKEEEEEAHLLDTTCEGSHESCSGSKTARSDGDDVEISKLSWPPNESSNENSNLSTALSSPSDMQTLSSKSLKSSRYSGRLDDDRPILGTVAAHWSPMSTARKWWDGKGILNSTNKYKEDQKVSWHAVPFEVRLEQALATQDSILSK